MIQTEPWMAPSFELKMSHPENGCWYTAYRGRAVLSQDRQADVRMAIINPSGPLVPPTSTDHKHREARWTPASRAPSPVHLGALGWRPQW